MKAVVVILLCAALCAGCDPIDNMIDHAVDWKLQNTVDGKISSKFGDLKLELARNEKADR